MNILLDCERIKNPNNGLQRFCLDYTQGMASVINANDKLQCYIPNSGYKFMGDKVSYYTQRFADRFIKRHISKLDIWHTLHQRSPYWGGDKYTKTVVTIHDLNFLYTKSSAKKIKQYIALHQRILNRADHIVAISEYTKNDILKYLNIGNCPISVIHNGCTLREFQTFNSPRYIPDKPYILALGAVVRKKNFHVLIPMLIGNDYELIIAGKISEYAEVIRATAKKMDVESRVKFLGVINEEEQYWYYKNCLAFGFPSLAEGFGLPPIEAMIFGKPVFLSKYTSLPEIGGDAAYYFDDFDAEHVQKAFQLGMDDYYSNHKEAYIKAHANSFSWERNAKEHYSIYKNLVSK